MAIVEFEKGALRIDAAEGLNVEPSLVQVRMREEDHGSLRAWSR